MYVYIGHIISHFKEKPLKTDMTIYKSSHFVSAAASGEDWRDASKKLLGQLESAKKDNPAFNFGFLYITDHLADDATSILNLFASVLGINDWVGTIGIGICSNGRAYVDQPAISAMLGSFDEGDFCIFPGKDREHNQRMQTLSPWLDGHEPMMIYVHGDPVASEDPAVELKTLEEETGGFLLGGLSSSRNEHIQFANEALQGGLSGVAFSQNVAVATTLSQGCQQIGQAHTITRGSDHIIFELDKEKASDVFEDDLRLMAIRKTDRDPDEIIIDQQDAEEGRIPEEFKSLLKGEVHAAFPISGSDQNDYLVRNIINVEPEAGSMMIAQEINGGERIIFVHRDDKTVQEDLSKSLISLRERVVKDTGGFQPKGALYISCVARAFTEDGNNGAEKEMKLVRDIIGDVPLTGFYAGGEISKARLYGYTGILTLFL